MIFRLLSFDILIKFEQKSIGLEEGGLKP